MLLQTHSREQRCQTAEEHWGKRAGAAAPGGRRTQRSSYFHLWSLSSDSCLERRACAISTLNSQQEEENL